MELQLHQHFDTHMDPSCSLHKATNHILYSLLDWNRKNNGSKKAPKVRKHGVAVFGQARIRVRVVPVHSTLLPSITEPQSSDCVAVGGCKSHTRPRRSRQSDRQPRNHTHPSTGTHPPSTCGREAAAVQNLLVPVVGGH